MALVLVLTTLVLYAAGTVAGFAYLSGRGRAARWHYRLLVAAGLLTQTALGLVRWQASGQFPVTQATESAWLLAWFMVLAMVLLDAVYGVPALATFLLPVAMVLSAAGLWSGSPGTTGSGSWLPMHVVAVLLGFCGFAVAAASGVLYLLQEKRLKAKRSMGLSTRLPSLETLDRLNFHALVFGFVLLTAGLGIGIAAAVVTRELGRTWWTDPKVILSCVVWGFNGAVVACRGVRSLSGRPIARLTVLGFALVLLVLVAADRLVPGVHARVGQRTEATEQESSGPAR